MKTTFVGYFRYQAPMLFWFLPGLAVAAIILSSIPPTTERDVLLGIIFALVMACIWLVALAMEAMVLRQRTRDRVGHLVYRIVHQVSTCANPDGQGPYIYVPPPGLPNERDAEALAQSIVDNPETEYKLPTP